MAINPNEITSSDHPQTMLINAPEPTFRQRVKENIDTLWQRVSLLNKKNPANVGLGGLPEQVVAPAPTPIIPPVITPPTTPAVVEQYFGAYNTIGGDTVGLTDIDLELHQVERSDPKYAHNIGDADVEVQEVGDYEIILDGGFNIGEGDTVEMRLQLDSGAGFNDIDGAKAYCSA